MSSWIQVNIKSEPALAEAVADFIHTLTGRGVEIDDSELWQVTGFLDQGENGPLQLAALKQYLQSLNQPYELSVSRLADQDWHENWRQNFAPFQMSQQIWICPPWQMAILQPGQFSIIIDPGQAFGTGQHESTRLCLLALEAMAGSLPGQALDVGCGTGILAIAFLKLGGKSALGIDIDPLALEASAHNAALNGLKQLELSERPISQISETFPLVMANLTALDLCSLASAISKTVQAGGLLLCSGILLSQVEQVIAAFSGFVLEKRAELNGWSALSLRKAGELA